MEVEDLAGFYFKKESETTGNRGNPQVMELQLKYGCNGVVEMRKGALYEDWRRKL